MGERRVGSEQICQRLQSIGGVTEALIAVGTDVSGIGGMQGEHGGLQGRRGATYMDEDDGCGVPRDSRNDDLLERGECSHCGVGGAGAWEGGR